MTEKGREFKKLWEAGIPAAKIGITLGISARHVRRIRTLLGLKPRKPGRPKENRWV